VADARVPYLRVVRGDATPEEIAALVAALSAVAANWSVEAVCSEPSGFPRPRGVRT